MIRKTTTLIFAGALLTATATAADVRSLSLECETALALSAVPVHLREGAGVYVLGDRGYELRKKPDNGFACIVERNHADAIIPQCFDRTSQEANLVAILDTGTHIRGGKSFEEIGALRQQALEDGDYATPGPGIAYMISGFNYIYNDQNGSMLDVGPHLMFHAPGLDGDDIGANFSAAMENRGLPTINAAGPHGFMISFVEKPSDSADVLAACDGELPDRAAMTPFPPKR